MDAAPKSEALLCIAAPVCGITVYVMDRLSLLLLPCLRSLGRQAPNHAGWVRPASWLHGLVLAGALVGGLATLSGAASSDLIASLLAGRADPGSRIAWAQLWDVYALHSHRCQ